MSSTDPMSEDDTDQTGPHGRFESLVFGPPSPDVDADQSLADLAADPTRAEDRGPAVDHTAHTGLPADAPLRVGYGDRTVAARIEVDLFNPTVDPITDTITTRFEQVLSLPFSTERDPLWSPRSTTLTLASGETTTVALSGDGVVVDESYLGSDAELDESPNETFLGEQGGGVEALAPGLDYRVRTTSANADDADTATTPLTVERTRVVLAYADYQLTWYGDGQLELVGPAGTTRWLAYPDETGLHLPGGVTGTNTTYDVDGTGVVDDSERLGGLAPTQYLRSDTDDVMNGVLDHSTSGSYDPAIPRGDGERERYSSGLGGLAFSLAGGHGRAALAWNALYDTSAGSWKYNVGSEEAMVIDIDDGTIGLRAAGIGTAGASIPFQEVRYNGKSHTFYHNQATSQGVVWQNGSSAGRPAAPVTGQRYFDTTLGKPIWYNGTNWVDAQGTVV